MPKSRRKQADPAVPGAWSRYGFPVLCAVLAGGGAFLGEHLWARGRFSRMEAQLAGTTKAGSRPDRVAPAPAPAPAPAAAHRASPAAGKAPAAELKPIDLRTPNGARVRERIESGQALARALGIMECGKMTDGLLAQYEAKLNSWAAGTRSALLSFGPAYAARFEMQERFKPVNRPGCSNAKAASLEGRIRMYLDNLAGMTR